MFERFLDLLNPHKITEIYKLHISQNRVDGFAG